MKQVRLATAAPVQHTSLVSKDPAVFFCCCHVWSNTIGYLTRNC